jgi:anti-anti-sigma factor
MTATSGHPGFDAATCVVVSVPSPGHCGYVHLMVSGAVDMSTAPELDRRLHDHLDTLPAGWSLLVDLSRVGHFSAAGVHVLQRVAATARDRRIALHLGPLSRQVHRVLDLCEVDITDRF